MERVRTAAGADVVDQLVERVLGAVVGRDHAHQPAPHRERQRGLQQFGQVVMEGGLVDHGAALFAAQVGGPRAERDDFVSGGEADAIGEHVAALVLERDLLDRVRRLVELPRPRGRRLDELARHVAVVAEVPGVHPGRGRGRERGVGGLGPGDPDAARFLGDLDRGVVGDPAHLVGQEDVARDGVNHAGGGAVCSPAFSALWAAPAPPVLSLLTRRGCAWGGASPSVCARVVLRFIASPPIFSLTLATPLRCRRLCDAGRSVCWLAQTSYSQIPRRRSDAAADSVATHPSLRVSSSLGAGAASIASPAGGAISARPGAPAPAARRCAAADA